MKEIDKAVLIIAQEKEAYRKALDLAKEKHNSLKQKDLQRLDEVVKKEQGALFEIKLAQQKREKILREVASAMQLPPEELNLRTLAQLAPDRQKENIENLRVEFSKLVDEYKRQDTINRRIIEDELDYIGFVMNFSTREGSAANNYDQAGNTGREPAYRAGLFDQKA